jgi:hypothetical protein
VVRSHSSPTHSPPGPRRPVVTLRPTVRAGLRANDIWGWQSWACLFSLSNLVRVMSNIHTHLSTPRRVPQFSGRPLLSRPFAIRWRDIFKRLTRRSRLSRRHSSRYRCPTPRFTHTTSLFWASIGPFAFPWRETACGGRHRRGIAPRHTTTPHHHAWRVTWLNQRRCSPDDLRPGQAGRSMARMATVLALLACVLLCQVRAKEGGTGH